MNATRLKVLYAVYAITAVFQFDLMAALVSSLVLFGAVGATYAFRGKAGGAEEAHLTWLIRTFWIGTGVILPILTVIAAGWLLATLDFQSLLGQVESGAIDDPAQMQEFMTQTAAGPVRLATLVCGLPFLAWWFSRLWRGFSAFRRGTPLLNPQSWL